MNTAAKGAESIMTPLRILPGHEESVEIVVLRPTKLPTKETEPAPTLNSVMSGSSMTPKEYPIPWERTVSGQILLIVPG